MVILNIDPVNSGNIIEALKHTKPSNVSIKEFNSSKILFELCLTPDHNHDEPIILFSNSDGETEEKFRNKAKDNPDVKHFHIGDSVSSFLGERHICYDYNFGTPEEIAEEIWRVVYDKTTVVEVLDEICSTPAD